MNAIALRRKRRQDGFIDAAKDKLVSLLSRAKDSINPVDSFSAKLKKALVKAIAYAIRGGFIGFFKAGRLLEKISNRLAVSKESAHMLIAKLVASASKIVKAVLSKIKRGDDSANKLVAARKRDAALKLQINRYIDKAVANAIRRRNDGVLDKLKEKAVSAIKAVIEKLDPRESKAQKAKKLLLKGLKAIQKGGADAIGKVAEFFGKYGEIMGLFSLGTLGGIHLINIRNTLKSLARIKERGERMLREVSQNGDI